MYIETIIDDKVQALAIVAWKPEFLFYRDANGFPLNATKAKVESAWGTVDFFTCSYPNPRRYESVSVRLLIGANAYACIMEGEKKTDILLSAGQSAQASLRDYARDQRERAERLLDLASLAERAADKLDSQAERLRAVKAK